MYEVEQVPGGILIWGSVPDSSTFVEIKKAWASAANRVQIAETLLKERSDGALRSSDGILLVDSMSFGSADENDDSVVVALAQSLVQSLQDSLSRVSGVPGRESDAQRLERLMSTFRSLYNLCTGMSHDETAPMRHFLVCYGDSVRGLATNLAAVGADALTEGDRERLGKAIETIEMLGAGAAAKSTGTSVEKGVDNVSVWLGVLEARFVESRALQ